MKKIILLVIILILSLVCLQAEIRNEDRPLRGAWSFELQEEWRIDRAGEDILARVQTFQIDSDGRVFLYEARHNRFYVFDVNGRFLFTFGKQGEGPGEYRMAFTFFLVDDLLIVPDQGRLHYFRKDGTFQHTVLLPQSMLMPRLFLDSRRFLAVREGEPEGKATDELEIFHTATGERQSLLTIQAETALTAKLESGGRTMVMKMKISDATPMVVAALHGDTLFYGKNDLYRIVKCDLNGREKMSFSIPGRTRKRISAQAKKRRISAMSTGGSRIPAEMQEQLLKSMPDLATLFSRISIEEDGLIYVYLNDPDRENSRLIDVFSPRGEYLYRASFQLPGELIITGPFLIKGDRLLVYAEDEEGERLLIRYRINKPRL